MNKYLLILRGVSGSGKSTFAQRLQKTFMKMFDSPDVWLRVKIVSADDYFLRPDGYYDFNSKLLGQAHSWCKNKAKECMSPLLPHHVIIVDNTNTRKWEYKDYLDLAKEYGYRVEEYMIGDLDQASVELYAKRNTHKVPLDTVIKMAKRFER